MKTGSCLALVAPRDQVNRVCALLQQRTLLVGTSYNMLHINVFIAEIVCQHLPRAWPRGRLSRHV